MCVYVWYSWKKSSSLLLIVNQSNEWMNFVQTKRLFLEFLSFFLFFCRFLDSVVLWFVCYSVFLLLLFGSLLTCHDFVRRRWWFPGIRDFFPHIWTVFVIIIIHEWSSLVNESRIGLFMFMLFHCFVQCLHFFYVRLNNHQFSFHSFNQSIHPSIHSIQFPLDSWFLFR